MPAKTRIYVWIVCVVAIVWGLVLFRIAPEPSVRFADVALMGLLALAGEGLTFALPRSATGSMAFIPYLSMALIAPGWECVVGIAVVRVVVELRSSRAAIKQTFNVAAHALMGAIAASIYLFLGGVSLTHLGDIAHVTTVTAQVGAPALLASGIGLAANNLLVCGAVAIASGRRVRDVWNENHRSTLGIDFLATPLIFVFAWAYAAFGLIVTATLWIPILGLRQLQRTNLELEKTNQELLELMVKSLEARDAYTSGHSRRVHHYSTIIARALGLPENEIQQIGKAALLHDVGKIHEKYAKVLSKHDRLTPDEWTLIREHANDGAELVSTMSHLRDIVPAVRHHHENWDGTGYPDGLAGDRIPLASRIIRFADTLDAMTTERPYRGPLGETEVRTEFVRYAGIQFDPDIAAKLLSSALWNTLFAPHSAASNSTLRVLDRGRSSQRRTRAAV